MKFAILLSLAFLVCINGKSQSEISFSETVSYINHILESNTQNRWCVYKMQADKYGHLKFFSAMGEYWFNINDVIRIDMPYYFAFNKYYKIKCSISDCEMGYTLNKQNEKENAIWPGIGLQFLEIEYEDQSRLINAFKHLKELTNDPFK